MKKVYIEYQFKEGPYGGANQFLKNLRDYLVKKQLYTEDPKMADFIIVNHTNISKRIFKVKRECPEKIIVHRMDGPVSKHRKHTLALDKQAFFLDKLICTGTVFQSKWTEESCYEIGYQKTGFTKIINNAPNPEIFVQKENRKFTRQGKIKLVTTSWSPNWNKGFDVLEYLDKNLDFEKYECTFAGRSPIEFENIKILPALATKELSEELKKHDIFIAVSKNESCSNSLIEAINCGLPVVARESGCYKEIIKEGGILVSEKEEIAEAINKVVEQWEMYQERLPYYHIDDIGKQYYNFMLELAESIDRGNIPVKRIKKIDEIVWGWYVLYIKSYIRLTDYYSNHLAKK